MATGTQDKSFASIMQSHVSIANSALDEAIDWIKNELNPHEIFDKNQLIDWASGEEPDEIFSKEQLEAWAESNGYVKE